MDGCRCVADLTADAAVVAANKVLMGELSLGQTEQYISTIVSGFLSQYGPQVAAQLAKIAEPAARKAAEIVGPVVEQKLKEQVPLFATIVGGLLAVSVIAGVYISKATYSVVRR